MINELRNIEKQLVGELQETANQQLKTQFENTSLIK